MNLVQRRTRLKAGQKHEALFKGKTLHSGGSCQFAISPDDPPRIDSEFKVITSIEGNCPGEIDRNLDPQPFYIPANAANGNYTLAWTWFPHTTGSKKPEMWMECAAVEIVGSMKKKKKKPKNAGKGWLKKLPTMFIGNVNVHSYDIDEETKNDFEAMLAGKYGPEGRWNRLACITKPNTDVAFPLPGNNFVNNVETGYKDTTKDIKRENRQPTGEDCEN
ncbi:hypothetical protein IWX47DRAFT_829521, partial [Phyllosticta citricarpa]